MTPYYPYDIGTSPEEPPMDMPVDQPLQPEPQPAPIDPDSQELHDCLHWLEQALAVMGEMPGVQQTEYCPSYMGHPTGEIRPVGYAHYDDEYHKPIPRQHQEHINEIMRRQIRDRQRAATPPPDHRTAQRPHRPTMESAYALYGDESDYPSPLHAPRPKDLKPHKRLPTAQPMSGMGGEGRPKWFKPRKQDKTRPPYPPPTQSSLYGDFMPVSYEEFMAAEYGLNYAPPQSIQEAMRIRKQALRPDTATIGPDTTKEWGANQWFNQPSAQKEFAGPEGMNRIFGNELKRAVHQLPGEGPGERYSDYGSFDEFLGGEPAQQPAQVPQPTKPKRLHPEARSAQISHLLTRISGLSSPTLPQRPKDQEQVNQWKARLKELGHYSAYGFDEGGELGPSTGEHGDLWGRQHAPYDGMEYDFDPLQEWHVPRVGGMINDPHGESSTWHGPFRKPAFQHLPAGAHVVGKPRRTGSMTDQQQQQLFDAWRPGNEYAAYDDQEYPPQHSAPPVRVRTETVNRTFPTSADATADQVNKRRWGQWISDTAQATGDLANEGWDAVSGFLTGGGHYSDYDYTDQQFGYFPGKAEWEKQRHMEEEYGVHGLDDQWNSQPSGGYPWEEREREERIRQRQQDEEYDYSAYAEQVPWGEQIPPQPGDQERQQGPHPAYPARPGYPGGPTIPGRSGGVTDLRTGHRAYPHTWGGDAKELFGYSQYVNPHLGGQGNPHEDHPYKEPMHGFHGDMEGWEEISPDDEDDYDEYVERWGGPGWTDSEHNPQSSGYVPTRPSRRQTGSFPHRPTMESAYADYAIVGKPQPSWVVQLDQQEGHDYPSKGLRVGNRVDKAMGMFPVSGGIHRQEGPRVTSLEPEFQTRQEQADIKRVRGYSAYEGDTGMDYCHYGNISAQLEAIGHALNYNPPGDFGGPPTDYGDDISPEKAREILHDGTVHGHPITDKQRRFFGAKSNYGTDEPSLDELGPEQAAAALAAHGLPPTPVFGTWAGHLSARRNAELKAASDRATDANIGKRKQPESDQMFRSFSSTRD